MKHFLVGIIVFVAVVFSYSVGFCTTPAISGVDPQIVAGGDMLTVTGNNFDSTTVVNITDPKDNTTIIPVKPDKLIGTTKLQFKVPRLEAKSDTKVKFVLINGITPSAPPTDFNYYSNPVDPDISKVILLKNDGMRDSDILERISDLHQKDVNKGETSTAFSGVPIETDAQLTLKAAGFDSDFIAKLSGIKQYVTFGTGAIYMTKTGDIVAAPMARIFLSPRSYYAPRVPLFSIQNNLRTWLSGMAERFDVNIGYTVIQSKVTDSSQTVNTNYALAGGSFEMNKAALLNFGWAVPTKNNPKNGQLYLGVTLDYNILKQLQIVP